MFQIMRSIKVDPDFPSFDFVILHVSSGAECRRRISEFDEGNPARSTGFQVGYHAEFNDATQFGKGRVELFFGGVEGQIANEDVMLLVGCRVRKGWHRGGRGEGSWRH